MRDVVVVCKEGDVVGIGCVSLNEKDMGKGSIYSVI